VISRAATTDSKNRPTTADTVVDVLRDRIQEQDREPVASRRASSTACNRRVGCRQHRFGNSVRKSSGQIASSVRRALSAELDVAETPHGADYRPIRS